MTELKNIVTEGKIVKGTILLTLAIMGNYTGELLSCRVQKLLSENILMKHIVSFFILYFAVDFTSDTPLHPSHIIINAFVIYLIFLMFNKLNVIFTIIVFLIFAIIYILTTYRIYYDYTDNKKYQYMIDNIDNISNIFKFTGIIILIIGFVTYFRKQYREHSKNWSSFKFLFGVIKCKSMK